MDAVQTSRASAPAPTVPGFGPGLAATVGGALAYWIRLNERPELR